MPMPTRQHVPDVLECLAQLSSDEVPTPPKIANQMLDLLPGDVWRDPDLRWLDPFSKSGVFLREIVRRLLFEGLVEWEPDFDKRRDHIFRNMIFGCGITELTGVISRRTVYYSRRAAGEHSVVQMHTDDGNVPFVRAEHSFDDGRCQICGAPEDLERGESRENYAYAFIHDAYPTEEMGDMKFDVIVGNPPYQIDSDGNTRTKPIYQLFVERAIKMDPQHVLMISPSRWFSGGLGLDNYRGRMLGDKRMTKLVDYPSLYECFPGVEIKGGVSYFLWSREHAGDCEVVSIRDGVASEPMVRGLDEFDVFVRLNSAVPILRKVRAMRESTLSEKVASRVPFGLQANFKTHQDEAFEGSVKVYGQKFVGHVPRSEITKNAAWIDEWKALLPAASDGHGRVPASVVPRALIAGPGEACTDTYLVVGRSESREAIEYLATFLATRFARFLIHIRKVAQHNKPGVFAFVPDLPMDREWTDAALYERYGIEEDEIAFIESQIKDMPVAEPGLA